MRSASTYGHPAWQRPLSQRQWCRPRPRDYPQPLAVPMPLVAWVPPAARVCRCRCPLSLPQPTAWHGWNTIALQPLMPTSHLQEKLYNYLILLTFLSCNTDGFTTFKGWPDANATT